MPQAQRPQCNRMALSYYKETAYGSAFNDSALTLMFAPNTPTILDMTQTREDDAATIKGYEFPFDTDMDLCIAQDVQIAYDFPGNLNLLGWLFSLLAGADTVTTTGTSYAHTFKIQDACTMDQAVSTDLILGLIGDTSSFYRVKGVCLGDMKLSVSKPGRVQATGTFHTDGTITRVSSFSMPQFSSAADVVLGINSDFLIGPAGGGLTSKKSLFMGFDLTINNNLDIADARLLFAGANQYLSSLRFGNRTLTMTLRVQGHQGDEFWGYWLNDTVLHVQFILTKTSALGTRNLIVDLPKCKIAQIKQSFNGIRDQNEITFKMFYNQADASPYILTVTNAVPAYLATGPYA